MTPVNTMTSSTTMPDALRRELEATTALEEVHEHYSADQHQMLSSDDIVADRPVEPRDTQEASDAAYEIAHAAVETRKAQADALRNIGDRLQHFRESYGA